MGIEMGREQRRKRQRVEWERGKGNGQLGGGHTFVFIQVAILQPQSLERFVPLFKLFLTLSIAASGLEMLHHVFDRVVKHGLRGREHGHYGHQSHFFGDYTRGQAVREREKEKQSSCEQRNGGKADGETYHRIRFL